MVYWHFGVAWVAFALAVALHVCDEGAHNFLAIYNPNAQAIRRRLHLRFPPTFTFRSWLTSLGVGIAVLLVLSPLAFYGAHWFRVAALLLAILAGIGNACLHIAGSIFTRQWLPGILSSPVLLVAGTWLVWAALDQTPGLV